ncbi:hypothetical protein KDL29_00385 [bacterium]|nr:hypothetical protein [bacterium]
MRFDARLIPVQILLLIAVACSCSQEAKEPARLTILVSANTMGYLRNCGCATGQYGGELRRARVLKEQREEALKSKPSDKGRPSDVLVLDLGSSVGGTEFIDRLYSRQVLKSMAQNGYGMVGLGKADLEFGQQDLLDYLKQAQELGGEGSLPLTSVNLHFGKPAQGVDCSRELNEMISKYRIIELAEGFKVGVIHAIDPGVTLETIDGNKVEDIYGFKVMPMDKAVQQVIEQHQQEADFWIFTLGDGAEAIADPKQIADIEGLDLVIGFPQGNPNQKPGSDGVTWPYFVRGPILKARDLVEIVVNFPETADDDRTVTARQLAVGSKVKGDETVLGLIDEIYPEIEKYENEKINNQKVVVRPRIMGQETCNTCHANIYQAMLGTKHQLAFQTLEEVAATDPERKHADKDSKCLSCHVTEYISPNGGWNKIDKPEELAMVSCESCHGPAEFHVTLMTVRLSGKSDDSISDEQIPPGQLDADGRNEFGIMRGSADTCKKCHDAENSPKFNFDEYWSRIQHSKDMAMPESPSDPASEPAPAH